MEKEAMLKITSRENRLIKLAVHLREKKYRERERAFWLEGERAVREILPRTECVRHFFILEDLWPRWQPLIPPEAMSRVCLLPEKLGAAVSAAETFSGIGAIVDLPEWGLDALFAQRGTLLYLDHVADPGNVGTMIRTAQAFDLGGLLLSPGSADPFNPKVARSAMGMLLNFPILTGVTAEDLKGAAERYGFCIVGTTLNEKSEVHYQYRYSEPQIIVIGSEAFGITSEIDDICHKYVKIPISFKAESLNAAVACGIIAAEINRQQDIQRRTQQP